MVLSCVPMTLSSIYKEIALGETDLDPILLNGYIAFFQFACSVVLSIPAGLAASPPIYPSAVPSNLLNGFKCYIGIGSVFTGCHTDEMCAGLAPLFVNVYLSLNLCYNILIIFVLKFGSSNVLWLALTIMVPVGNVAFCLPFMPGGGEEIHASDVIGLAVILLGLVMYRFGISIVGFMLPASWNASSSPSSSSSLGDENRNDLTESLLGNHDESESTGDDGVSV